MKKPTTENERERTFRRNLRTLREELGLTQPELGIKARTPASSVSHFEAGKRMPGFKTLLRLAAALDVTLDRLVYGFCESDYQQGKLRGRAEMRIELEGWLNQDKCKERIKLSQQVQMIEAKE